MKAKYILLAAAFVFAAACEKPMTDISEDSVSLDLSDIEKYMPYSGGDFNISVATNCDEWDFRYHDEWLEVSAEGNTLSVSVDENADQAFRKGYIYVIAYNDDLWGLFSTYRFRLRNQ